MDTKTIFCIYCRQRLSINPKETSVACPGCKLILILGNDSTSSSTSTTSSTWEENKGKLFCQNEVLNLHFKMKLKSHKGPKKSLNSQPFSLLTPPSKRAVLCGVSYTGKFRLKGSINDVKNMRDLLINSFQFLPEAILVLTEEETEPIYTPTKKNIETALKWLVKDCRKGDSLVFYFSGHGLRQPEFKGDETDGFDETICPVDFLEEGMIVDNDINSIIVKPLKNGVTLHAIVDACHSGTILDLEYVYNRDKMKWDDNKPPSGASKATGGGLAVCLSACLDNQLASDSSAFTGKTMNGVMTYILVDLVKKNKKISYGELIDKIQDGIEDVKKIDCLLSNRFLKRFFKDKLSQKPLLSSSAVFDVYKTPILL